MKVNEVSNKVSEKSKELTAKLSFDKNQWMSIAVGAAVAAVVAVVLTLIVAGGGSDGKLSGTYHYGGPAIAGMEDISNEELEEVVDFGSGISYLTISELGDRYSVKFAGAMEMKLVRDRGMYIVFASDNTPFATIETNKKGLILYPILLEEEESITSVEEESVISKLGVQMVRVDEYNPGIPKKVFQDADMFVDNNLAAVKIEGEWGFIDKKGDIAISPNYEAVTHFSGGYAYAKEEKKYGIIDTEGNWVVEPEYDSYILDANVDSSDMKSRHRIFSQGYATVNKDGDWIHITKEGEVSDGVEENKRYLPFSENGLALVTDLGDESTSVVDTDYNEVFKIDAKNKTNFYIKKHLDSFSVSPFINGLIMVNTPDDTTMYLNETGQSVLETESMYDRCTDFSNGLAAVRLEETEKWGFINREGDLVIDAKYDGWDLDYGRKEELIPVKYNDYMGIIDHEGSWIIPPTYENITPVKNGYMVEAQSGSGYIDKKGKVIIPPSYPRMSYFVDGAAIIKLGSSYTYIDEKGRFLWQAE